VRRTAERADERHSSPTNGGRRRPLPHTGAASRSGPAGGHPPALHSIGSMRGSSPVSAIGRMIVSFDDESIHSQPISI